jgi:hypothetical protein
VDPLEKREDIVSNFTFFDYCFDLMILITFTNEDSAAGSSDAILTQKYLAWSFGDSFERLERITGLSARGIECKIHANNSAVYEIIIHRIGR